MYENCQRKSKRNPYKEQKTIFRGISKVIFLIKSIAYCMYKTPFQGTTITIAETQEGHSPS